jgi:hypothetical protein
MRDFFYYFLRLYPYKNINKPFIYKTKVTVMSAQNERQHISWFIWPFWAIWRLITLIIGLTGRLIGVILGLVLLLVGAILCFTVLLLPLGIPFLIVGFLLVVRALF